MLIEFRGLFDAVPSSVVLPGDKTVDPALLFSRLISAHMPLHDMESPTISKGSRSARGVAANQKPHPNVCIQYLVLSQHLLPALSEDARSIYLALE